MPEHSNSVESIYFYCPSSFATGGTELAHQGASELIKQGYRSFMFYSSPCDDPIPDRFKKYQVPYCFHVEDSKKNLIVLPETALGLSTSFSKAHMAAWWMSVDNFLQDCSLMDALRNRCLKTVWKYPRRRLKNKNKPITNRNIILARDHTRFDIHLYQSEYARKFLLRNGVKSLSQLSDFINPDLVPHEPLELNGRNDRVLYNPLKGFDITKKIMAVLEGDCVEMTALKGLSINELKQIFRTSKIYIDFGNHPGKDRLLREAALNGCVIITGLRGAASFEEDVPIGRMFKFGESSSELKKACNLIRDVLLHHETYYSEQAFYHDYILNEPDQFVVDLKKCFEHYPNAKH
jgi:hypothetical protein